MPMASCWWKEFSESTLIYSQNFDDIIDVNTNFMRGKRKSSSNILQKSRVSELKERKKLSTSFGNIWNEWTV